jgi:glycosyltransferase involved in cell wall biosynthesis
MSRTPGVLIVDQGASFGGSVLVAAVVANRMPLERYRVHLAASVDPSVLRADPAAAPRITHVAKSYDYVAQARNRERLASLPRLIRRIGGWSDTTLRMVRNSGYTRRLAALIREQDIGLVHLNNGFENLEAHLAAALTRRPVVVHAHGPCGDSYISRRLAPNVPACIGISGPVAESFEKVGVPRARVALLPNPLTVTARPIDRHAVRAARERYGIPADRPIAGIVGRIVAWKGQLEFLRAVAVALREVPDAGAVVIGEVTDASDAYGRQVREEAARLGIEDRVWFTGFISEPREAYALLDVLVHSSIDPEPFGLVLTEAMAFGIPVVAARSGGPLEIVTDGVDGFLMDPRDPEPLGILLARLLADRELREQIGRAGQESVLRRFDPDVYVTRIAEVYDGVLAGHGERVHE